jgi:hypothetical protein
MLKIPCQWPTVSVKPTFISPFQGISCVIFSKAYGAREGNGKPLLNSKSCLGNPLSDHQESKSDSKGYYYYYYYYYYYGA